MYTLQSGQIENALRGAGVPDISAKEMMQGVANCASPIEHRGAMAFTQNPRDGRYLYPQPPAEGTPDNYVPPSVMYSPQFTRQIFIDIPPWQNVPWVPIPYPDHQEWKPIPFPEWPAPTEPTDDITVVVNGPMAGGPAQFPTVTSDRINSTTIVNEGDIFNLNRMVMFGPVFHNGPVFNQHRHVNNGPVINNRFVVNNGPVINRNVVNNAFCHNFQTINHGPMQTYGQGDFYGPVTFGDDVSVSGDVYVNGAGPMANVSQTLLTDVEWTGTALVKKYRTVTLVGSVTAETTSTVVSGTSCPSSPLPAAASNFIDAP